MPSTGPAPHLQKETRLQLSDPCHVYLDPNATLYCKAPRTPPTPLLSKAHHLTSRVFPFCPISLC